MKAKSFEEKFQKTKKLEHLKTLYQRMADLTRAKCGDCPTTGKVTCCSPEYGEMTIQIAERQGLTLARTGNPKCDLLGPNGCTAEPWLRPLCALHICEKLLMTDPAFCDQYYPLRTQINVLEYQIGRVDD